MILICVLFDLHFTILIRLLHWQWDNHAQISWNVRQLYTWPYSQILQYTSPISHNAPFCNRNVHIIAHLCYKMVYCGIFVWCIVRFLRRVYWPYNSLHLYSSVYVCAWIDGVACYYSLNLLTSVISCKFDIGHLYIYTGLIFVFHRWQTGLISRQQKHPSGISSLLTCC